MNENKKEFDYMVFIGRMQPPHKAHIEIIENALQQAKKVIVIIGSSNQPRTTKNPWNWREREEMIRACFNSITQERLVFFGISDTYNDQEWACSVQDIVSTTVTNLGTGELPTVGLVGHKKDASSFYLDMFPQWKFNGIDNIDDIHSTDIRTQMFEVEQIDGNNIPDGIFNYINAFMKSEAFTLLKKEYDFIKMYRQSWAAAPYAPTFVTVDAIVVQSGHVLLIRRRAEPGKNLWAISGGFVNQDERLEDAMIRELHEETKIKVPIPVLKGNIKKTFVADDPTRSLRGRTISHVFGIELPVGPLPKISKSGGDDADKAQWVPLNVFELMENQMFEDHFHLIRKFVKYLDH